MQGILLYVILVSRTHRVYGPIFLMRRQMEDILEGREHDDFKEFYDLFGKTIRHLKGRSYG